MRKKIKIQFSDWGKDLNPKEHFIYKVLAENYEIELSEKPDFLFYSCYGYDFKKYENCVKIYLTNECLVPNFNECDYACGFDFLTFGDRYMRLPMIFLEMENNEFGSAREAGADLARRKFCNFIYSNSFSGEGAALRQDFAKQLMLYKHIDCPGKVLNNMKDAIAPRFGDWIKGKLEFVHNYKFTIAFENCRSSGYTTEKLLHPLMAHSVPIYWGNPEVVKDFNPKAFINCNDYGSLDEVIEKVIELDNDEEQYLQMLREPPMQSDYKFDKYQKLAEFLDHIIGKGNQPFNKNPHDLSEEKALQLENNYLKKIVGALTDDENKKAIFKRVAKNGCIKSYLFGINISKKKIK